VQRIQRYTVDGVEYKSLDEMPPDVRRKWDRTAVLFDALRENLGKPGVTTTTVTFQETTTGDGPAAAELFERLKQQINSGRIKTVDGSIQPVRKDTRAKRVSAAFCTLFLPALALSFLVMFSSVAPIVRYSPAWTAGFVAWLCALITCTWQFRDRLRKDFFPKKDGTPLKFVGTAFAGLLGLGVIGGYGIFGGIPVVAHYLTARPGTMTVTVAAKDSSYQRYGCQPRLVIKEFTFFLQDHLCPDDRTFAEIDVGQRIVLQGDVSPYAISVERFYWTEKTP